MTFCAWSPLCQQEPGFAQPFCYFHQKRALKIIEGRAYSEGRSLGFEMQPPSFEALEIIEQMMARIEPDDD